MTPRQIQLVQDSFAVIVPQREAVARLFYENLFTMEPGVRSMFPTDLADQGHKLMQVLAIVVRSLDNLAPLLATVDDLARRHVAYGVRDEHYPVVGSALLQTLRDGLGAAFDAETEEAWTKAYAILSARMIAAAAGGDETLAA